MRNFDPNAQASSHFLYKEMLWLPSWSRLATEQDGLSDDVLDRLLFLAAKLDVVRDFFGKPLRIHVWYRPLAYNAHIGGAKNSAHVAGYNAAGAPLAPGQMEAAVDFDVEGMSCDDARQMILKQGKLQEWGLRMEDNGAGSNWLHLDCRAPLHPGHWFFKP
jgi:hypothetical protein